jgi:alpha-mannosidase
MTNRRTFLAWLGALPLPLASSPPLRRGGTGSEVLVEVRPTALYEQPDGRRNLVRITVSGLTAPAARARVIDRRGALAGTAGLLPSAEGPALAGEVSVPLSEPSDFRIDVEVGKDRVARQRVRLAPPRRWSLYLLSSIHTDVGYTDLQERCLEIHRQNLDAALARLARQPDFRWSPECALQVISYFENRSAEAGEVLLHAIRDGKVGFHALFANMLTGLLDHETFARVVWPAGLLARERGLTYAAAQITDVPGQTNTFPMVLAASGVRYLASGANPERALPLLPSSEAERYGLRGEWTGYPQLYWWEGPDGSRVLHWRAHHYGDATRFGFDEGTGAMGRRLSDWLLTHPALLSPAWPYDIALLYGLDSQDNAPVKERMIANVEEFNRRYAFPRILPARAEDFFRDLERRYATRIPVRRGDTGLYWEDGAASTAAELARFRGAQLAARAAELLALWDDRVEPRDEEAAERGRRRAEERRAMWRDLLLFGEHTWGAAVSVSQPDARQTVAQWEYKRRFLEAGGAAARRAVEEGLLRIGKHTDAGRGRVVCNASTWDRTDIVSIPGGAGQALSHTGREMPTVDLPDGSSLALVRDVPGLGYLALAERDRAPRPLTDEGAALEAEDGGFHVRLDAATGAIASLVGPDGKERVKPSSWSGLNQLVYVTGGARSAMWTGGDRGDLRNSPTLALAQAELVGARRERLPGIGVRLTAERRLPGLLSVVSRVTLYDEMPWVDIENRLTKVPTLDKEALYVAFPFAFTRPTVEVEVPLGRMTVERDQQPGSCRDWFCHAHWVWLREGEGGLLWSGPDTPLFTLNDIFRGEWRRRIEPDGTLFAYVLNNYWHTNYAARQGGGEGGALVARFRISLLAPGDPAEAVRRGWAACDPLYVSETFVNASAGSLLPRDRALLVGDRAVLVVSAKPADDGEGAVVRLLDVAGGARAVSVWPAAYAFQLARRTNLVEMNEGPLPVGPDRRTAVDIRAWGLASVRLFTPREGAG